MAIKPDFLKFEELATEGFEHARSTLINASSLINFVVNGYVGNRDEEVKVKLKGIIEQLVEIDRELIHDIGLILVGREKKGNE